MIAYLIALAVAALVLLIPQARRTALESLGVLAIAAGGVLALALPVWALYQVEPWLPPPTAPEPAAPDGGGQSPAAPAVPAQDLRLLEEESQRQAEAQRKREQEQARIAGIAQTIRGIVERERKYVALSASRSRLPGIEQLSADLIAIRIPSWRDPALAEREQALIVAWLYAIGLTAEETASIRTANGWGSVYDLWRSENPLLAATSPGGDAEIAEAPSETAAPALAPEAGSAAALEAALPPAPEVLTLERPSLTERRVETPRAAPRREPAAPRRPAPAGRAPPERAVGPFGY